MRSLTHLGVALLIVAGATLSAADPLAGLSFADGKSRSSADFAKQTLIVVQFCSH